MTFPPSGLSRPNFRKSCVPGAAYADDGYRRKQRGGAISRQNAPCKPRANYLKPKEYCERVQIGANGVLTCRSL
jgi:hypothetical protein